MEFLPAIRKYCRLHGITIRTRRDGFGNQILEYHNRRFSSWHRVCKTLYIISFNIDTGIIGFVSGRSYSLYEVVLHDPDYTDIDPENTKIDSEAI